MSEEEMSAAWDFKLTFVKSTEMQPGDTLVHKTSPEELFLCCCTSYDTWFQAKYNCSVFFTQSYFCSSWTIIECFQYQVTRGRGAPSIRKKKATKRTEKHINRVVEICSRISRGSQTSGYISPPEMKWQQERELKNGRWKNSLGLRPRSFFLARNARSVSMSAAKNIIIIMFKLTS